MLEAFALAAGVLSAGAGAARQTTPAAQEPVAPSEQLVAGTPLPTPPTQRQDDDARRIRGGGQDEGPPRRPDLSLDFDPFAPGQTPAPRPPPFDPSRPDLSWEADPLAGRIVGGAANAQAPLSPPPEAWRLPGRRRSPSLADPPPDSAPAVRAAGASGTDG